MGCSWLACCVGTSPGSTSPAPFYNMSDRAGSRPGLGAWEESVWGGGVFLACVALTRWGLTGGLEQTLLG